MISCVYITNRGESPFVEAPMLGRNQYRLLRECLERQTCKAFELVCVTPFVDAANAALIGMKQPLTIIRPPETPWRRLHAKAPTTARNAGLTAACGDIVLGLDDCVEFGPHLLERAMDYAARSLWLAPAFGRPGDRRPAGPLVPQEHCGGILAYPREAALDVGGHEDRFVGTFALEDCEFSERLRRVCGLRFITDPTVHVTLHAHAPGQGGIFRCMEAVHGLLRDSRHANELWTAEQLACFTASRCPFIKPRGVCAVAVDGQPCHQPARPTEAALKIMRSYESDV